MLILAVDTSARTGSIAVLRDQSVLGQIVNRSDLPYSSSFFGDLDDLLAQMDVSIHEFDLFAVGNGPGSFTGLRVGLTAVKAWSEVFSKPVVEVSCLQALALKVPQSPLLANGTLLAPVLDARRGQVYGCVYRWLATSQTLEPITDELVVTCDEFVGLVRDRMPSAPILQGEKIEPALIFVSPASELIRPAIERFGLGWVPVQEGSGFLASEIGRLGYAKALRGEVVDAVALDANYVRRPDAERNWKGK